MISSPPSILGKSPSPPLVFSAKWFLPFAPAAVWPLPPLGLSLSPLTSASLFACPASVSSILGETAKEEEGNEGEGSFCALAREGGNTYYARYTQALWPASFDFPDTLAAEEGGKEGIWATVCN